MKCRLAIEEITSSFLIPLASEHKIADPNITYELSVGEGREEADLVVGLDEFTSSGITDEQISEAADDVAKKILENLIKRKYTDDSGKVHFVIG